MCVCVCVCVCVCGEQVECIMAVMIYKSLMKGYFSHKSKVVVLSKADPFPKTVVP